MEVQSLKLRIRGLTRQLESKAEKDAQPAVLPSPKSVSVPPNEQPNSEMSRLKLWDGGITVSPPRSPNPTWFGPSSLYYFIKYLSDRLIISSNVPQDGRSNHLPNYDNSRLLLDDAVLVRTNPDVPPNPESEAVSRNAHFDAMKEQYFLDKFWHGCHTGVIPIIDEAAFKEYHQSLWAGRDRERAPSALVDILLAICLQGAIPTLSSEEKKYIADDADSSVSGRWHYRRCQVLLAKESESPSLATLQSHLLSAVYLCGGSFHNMVDASVAQAVRVAYMLGLHIEPCDMPMKLAEERRRLWWATFLMDTKINLKLGRPFLIPDSFASRQLPADNLEAARLSGSTFASISQATTWLTFANCHTTLYGTIRAAHLALFKGMVASSGSDGFHESLTEVDNLEAHARLVNPYIDTLDEWAAAVPPGLRISRQSGGKSLSTDSSPLVIEPFAPIWLQRQRVLLELAYHNLSAGLFRPFIPVRFQTMSQGLAEAHANRCLRHAIIFTRIAHHILTTTSILTGWHETFHWQWNAAISIVGFMLVYPQSSQIPEARDALKSALEVFTTYDAYFLVAKSACAIIEGLIPKIESAYQIGTYGSAAQGNISAASFGDSKDTGPNLQQGTTTNDLLYMNTNDENSQSLFDMALAIDFWDDMGNLWPQTWDIPNNSM